MTFEEYQELSDDEKVFARLNSLAQVAHARGIQILSPEREEQRAKREEAMRELQVVARKHGLSIEEIIGGPVSRSTGMTDTFYRHPDDPNKTWSGRGRQPAWVKQMVRENKGVKSR